MVRKILLAFTTLVFALMSCENFEPCTDETVVVCGAGLYYQRPDGTVTDTTYSYFRVTGIRADTIYFDSAFAKTDNVFFPLLNNFNDIRYHFTFDTIVQIFYREDTTFTYVRDTIPGTDSIGVTDTLIKEIKTVIDSVDLKRITEPIQFTYQNQLRLISHECGFTVDHRNISASAPMYFDTIIVKQPDVTNEFTENLRIVF